MKKGFLGSLSAAVLATVMIACGGSGGGGSSKPLSQTGRAVQELHWRSLMSMANGGLPLPGFTDEGGGAGTSGTTTGGGGGIPSMGGFIRNFGGPGGMIATRMSALKATREAETTGTTGGTVGSTDGGGGEPGSDFYFDEWLNLWVEWTVTDNSFSMKFYIDEAKTNQAGFMLSTFSGDYWTFPSTYQSSYEFTAGMLAGSHGSYTTTMTSEFEGAMTYDDTYVDGSKDHGTSAWTAEGATWSSEWYGPNEEVWYKDSGTWNFDGSSVYSSQNSAGWAVTWVYNMDGSGHAHFEGPDPKLPAELTWDASGHYHIEYADGTSENWSWEDYWEDEGGTTGVGTSSTGG
jgi:hypothetical protein